MALNGLQIFPSEVLAADADGRFAIDGVGGRSCGEFVDAYGKDQRLTAAFASWTNGFLSGVNVFTDNTFDITPFQPVELTLAKLNLFCTQNRDEPFVRAVGELVRVYNQTRLTQNSEMVRVDVEGKAVFVYEEVIGRIAKILQADQIIPEGTPSNEAVMNGLSAYQQRNGLPVTGLPDLATMNKMFP